VSDTFVPSETPDGYDFRGNRTENFVPEGTVPPEVEAPLPTPVSQVTVVAGESDGFKGTRGVTRDDIRARIRKVRPYSSVSVDIPEWDITVEVRSMSLGDRNDMSLHMVDMGGADGDNRKQFYPMVIATCTFDANGEKVWDESDLAWLNSLDANILDRIAKPAMELNGFDGEKAVEEAAGKSSGTETSASAS
jgi:hypothetical protein